MPMPVSRRIEPATVHRTLAIASLVTVFVVSVSVYIALVGKAAQRSVELRQLDMQVEALKESVSNLDQKIAVEQAMPNVQARVQALGFVPIDPSEYVPVVLHPTMARE